MIRFVRVPLVIGAVIFGALTVACVELLGRLSEEPVRLKRPVRPEARPN